MKDKNDGWRAEKEFIRSKMGRNNINTNTDRTKSQEQAAIDYIAEKNKAVNAILDRNGFRSDINVIMEMINKLRYDAAGTIVDKMLSIQPN